jgi:hypothetical protein
MLTIEKAKIPEAYDVKKLLNYVWIDTYKDFFQKELLNI